jgi:polycomb group RING finger protein 4
MSQKVDQSTSHSSSSASASLSIPCSSSLASQPQSSQKRTRLIEINPALTCILCNGYFIDATTISECLHSFCKSCIVKYLETNKCCPICEGLVHKTKPLLNIRSDKILQDIVYKLIPDVFKNEMQRRRDYYAKHSEAAPTTAEDRGEVPEHRMFYMPYDKISLSLEYGYGDNQIPENGYRTTPANQQTEKTSETETMRRYLLCPAGLSILHLKKFIATKYGLPNTYKVLNLNSVYSHSKTLQ